MVKTCNDPADMPTSSIIAVGTVFINGIPAAKEMDQVVGVDTHIIMVPSPGGPVPTPIPHPYAGKLMDGLSSSVKIMGMKAAVKGSKSKNLPPHVPCGPGPFQKPPSNEGEVMLGSFNVFIGDSGPSGSGSGGGPGSSATVAASAGSTQIGQAEQAEKAEENHYLKVKVVDKGGFPINGISYRIKTPNNETWVGKVHGGIERKGIAKGDYEIELRTIVDIKWSAASARDGETVKMQVETAGFDDDENVVFTVWEKDIDRPDRQVKEVAGVKLKGNKAEAEWQYEWVERDGTAVDSDKYSSPTFYFSVRIDGVTARSPLLDYKDSVEIQAEDDEGNPLKDEQYRVTLANGDVRTGKLDSKGYARIEKVPPGKWEVDFVDAETVHEKDDDGD